MRMTDGKATIKIRMVAWTGTDYSPDWSLDFFDAGILPHDDETDTYTVQDVGYCVEQAKEWERSNEDYLVMWSEVRP